MNKAFLVMAMLLTGCATSHYGREQAVIPAERTAYECPAIALEIAKCDAFTTSVYTQWSETKGRRFLGFLMDVGIGDRRERNDALESAETRRGELVELSNQKSCPAPPPPPQDD
jgi:hypothetical protein